MNALKEFKRTFKPYRERFRIRVNNQVPDMFGEASEWKEIQNILTDTLIEDSLFGKKDVGFFTRTIVPYLGLDIDCHDVQNVWIDEEASLELLHKYSLLKQYVGVYPSLVFKSKHGLHCYYCFLYPVASEILLFKAKKALQGFLYKIQSEMLPTPNKALKIDPVSSQLCPKTLKPIKYNLSDYEVYSPHLIFDEDLCASKSLLKSLRKERITQGKSAYKFTKLERLENDLIKGGFNFCSNEKIFKSALLPYYFHSNLTVDDAVYRVQKLLFQTNYVGELKDERRLRHRIESSYRSFEKNKNHFVYTGVQKEESLLLTDNLMIDNLVKDSKFSGIRQKTFRKFLENLLYWINFHDNIKKNPLEFTFWSYFYRSYRENRNKHNLYPIPSALMETWNKRYKEFTTYLESIHILIPRVEYFFDNKESMNNQCRYFEFKRIYAINSKSHDADFLLLLRNSGLSNPQIAEKIGVSRRTVQKWLSGETEIPKNKIEIYKHLWSEAKWGKYITT